MIYRVSVLLVAIACAPLLTGTRSTEYKRFTSHCGRFILRVSGLSATDLVQRHWGKKPTQAEIYSYQAAALLTLREHPKLLAAMGLSDHAGPLYVWLRGCTRWDVVDLGAQMKTGADSLILLKTDAQLYCPDFHELIRQLEAGRLKDDDVVISV